MSVGIFKPREPEAIPEHLLWRLKKNTRTADARVRMVPLGPELRIFVTRQSDNNLLDLVWSQVFRDGRELGAQSEQTKKDFEARGWSDDPLR